MFMQVRLAPAEAGMRSQGAAVGKSARKFRPGRLIPILLALYLIPALLVVLAVGGVGMLVLAVARAIAWIMHGPEVRPHRPSEPFDG
jgi:hypothetical protein